MFVFGFFTILLKGRIGYLHQRDSNLVHSNKGEGSLTTSALVIDKFRAFHLGNFKLSFYLPN